ncbi:MAG: flagellar hook protein FlgE [Coprobacillaceae bacterium]
MMRSLYSGISGLSVHQTKMDVIANNIANVNTVGYKSSRVTFSDYFSQTISGASAADAASGRGGTNPMQIGLGASVASIDINMTNGVGQRTGNNFDLLIDGSGFFVVGDSSGTYFTRAGAFGTDAYGNLTTSDGLQVYGWDVDEDGNPVRDNVKPIQISGEKVYSPPQTTKNVDLTGNLDSKSSVGDEEVANMQIFDSLGNSYTVSLQYTMAGSDLTTTPPTTTWNVNFGDIVYPNGDTNNPMKLEFDSDTGELTISDLEATDDKNLDYNMSAGDLVFNEDGTVNESLTTFKGNGDYTGAGEDNFVLLLESDVMAAATFGRDGDGKVNIDFSQMTQFNQDSDASSERLDGYKAGDLQETSVGSDGTIVATYSNGQTRVIYQIPVAQFANPAGLTKVGGNLFQQTINSGEFDGIGEAVTLSGGTMSSGMLEMSNVDLSSEFTEMITTQRGFQANSRVITTSDTLLEELVNLKR